jgi:O-antigen/teichoic acid export membrane protein
LVNLFFVIWFVKKYVKLSLAFDFDFWKKSLKQSFPLAISNILVMIYFSTDSLFLSIFRPVAEVGVYRLPYKILESLIFFPAMFVGLVMPLLSRASFTDWPRFKNIFQRSFDILLIFAVPLVAGTIILSPKIIRLLGGGGYSESAPIFNILIIAVGTIFLGTLFSFSLIAIEKQKKLLWISAVGAVFNVAANLVFMTLYSTQAIYVAAATTVLTEALVAGLMLFELWRAIKFLPSFNIFWKTFLASALMATMLWWLNYLNLFVLLALAVLVYFLALYLLKGYSANEVFELLKKNDSGQNI